MKTKMFLIAGIVLLIATLSGFSPALKPKASLQFHGEYDLYTNAPDIWVYHADNSYIHLGAGWTNLTSVADGDTWKVIYPISDCNTGAFVCLNGYYSLLDSNGTAQCTANIWLRMPTNQHTASWGFHFNKYGDGELTWTNQATEGCQKQ